ncbi:hypothetical protein PC129_g8329 [Phytophthora cactorum]|uniref:FAD-dependent oxidoreductase domain-containing protein 1 n=1 Tax=Phytophthora cactorum TaxID=29920 RepID=A0A329SW22_9STRA|nr:hypothetical protein Pcac1_g445 [Phytophthora cactorum]KAG2829308.1 hypothetical protein PC111_g7822 [Phytophthora cactorum]KAG2849566.1 hypothetical protein PC112_g167 [Phytophthora cactorum]KAG2857291.1 hypothetical protein PC113_g10819 [Phytophthora cactorum]KAG2921726.1 hypothetical protein PC115_g9429 [Phytophthora cactorum]
MLRKASADVVVVGAGVAGCSAFYHLARLNARNPGFKPLLVDGLPPLSLTSANGSFSYRNWFPSDAESPMRELVVYSINEMDDICKQTNNALGLNRNGYLFVTREAGKMEELKRLANNLERHGGGELRVHEPNDKLSGYRFSTEEMQYDLDGSDLLVGIDNIATAFPNLKDSNALAALHVRRCGSLNPVKVANYELNKAVEYCPKAEVLQGKVTDFSASGGNVSGVKVAMHNGDTLEVATPNVVFATGPLFERTLDMLKQREMSNYDVPIINELHCRAIVDDVDRVLPPTMPLTFDSDPMGKLEISDADRKEIMADPSAARMLKEYPGGVHVRPYNGDKMMAVWTYDIEPVPAHYPVEDVLDRRFPEVCVRGLTRMFPQVKSYLTRPEVRDSFYVSGGYYCKTLDNLPLIGPAPNTIGGVYLQSAMTGVGLMSSAASGHLLATHVMGETLEGCGLANHVDAFLPSRFEDQAYVDFLSDGGGAACGQV